MKPVKVNKKINKLYLIMFKITIHVQKLLSLNLKLEIVLKYKLLKKSFENEYSNNWNREIFVFNQINGTNRKTYKLKDLSDEKIIGCFCEYEIKKTAL